MCDFSGRLIAWMDHELPQDEADEVARHLQACPQCRLNLDAYAKASAAFNSYCEAVVNSKASRRLPHWAAAVSGVAAAAAAVAVLFLVLPRAHVKQLSLSRYALDSAPVPRAVVL